MERIKLTIQHDSTDCGAACLSMIARYYGLSLPLNKIRKFVKVDKSGANLYGIVTGGAKLGLKGDALSGTREELLKGIEDKEIVFPFIAHIVTEENMPHFVVVYGYDKGLFLIADPAKGYVKMDKKHFFLSWTGYIVVFEKKPDFKEGNYTENALKKYLYIFRGQEREFFLIFVISLFIVSIGIIGSLVFQFVIDNYAVRERLNSDEITSYEIQDKEIDNYESAKKNNPVNILVNKISDFTKISDLNIVFICLIGLYFIKVFIEFARGYLVVRYAKTIDGKLMHSFYNHIIDLPVLDVIQRNTGDYMSRFNDISEIRDLISGVVVTLTMDSFMTLAVGIILFLESNILFLISVIIIFVNSIIFFHFKKPIKKANTKAMEKEAVFQSFFKESIDGIETLKVLGAERVVKKNASLKINNMIDAISSMNIISIFQHNLTNSVESIGTVVVLWVGFALVINDNITIGTLMSFYALLVYFTTPVKNLISLQPQIQTAIVATERLADILELDKEMMDYDTHLLPKINDIKFENIDFRYGNGRLVLKNLNINIERGEKIALVGGSGCGKTTIAKLLLRLYLYEAGDIFINGNSINNIDPRHLRSNIAYVDNNIFFFADTIRNNLRLGNDEITDEDIKEACVKTHIDDYISSLPLGYNTVLIEGGYNLSNGQRQRLAIARALLKKPQVLILDEATSNLDTITESAIKQTIFDISKDTTCIIIAHRLASIKKCDRIYVIENGSVVEAGSHEELIKKNGLYCEMCKTSQV